MLKDAKRKGKVLVLQSKPELRPYLKMYLTAFWHLDTERSHGTGLTSIPWSSIVAYAHRVGMSEEQEHNLMFYIRKMDSAYLRKLHEDSEQD